MDWFSRLSRLGFSANEASVYICLLELGPSSCGPISQKTGLYRVMVYLVLESLVKRGLVSYFVRNRRRVFVAAPPQTILASLREKEFEARSLVAELAALRSVQMSEPSVSLYEGVYGVKAAQENYFGAMKKGRGEYLMFGASLSLHEKLDVFFNFFHKRRSQLKIPARLLFNENNREYGHLKNRFKPVQVRYMPKNVITPSWTSIYEDMMLVGILGEKPVVLFIKNRNLADSFRNYFELMWRLGKK